MPCIKLNNYAAVIGAHSHVSGLLSGTKRDYRACLSLTILTLLLCSVVEAGLQPCVERNC